MPRPNERNTPFTFKIEKHDLEAARAAFFSPENNQIELDSLFENLWQLADGDHKAFTKKNHKVHEILKRIFNHINEAQRFNESYLGHMLSEPAIATLYAYMMAMRINSNTVAREVSVLESELEPEAIRWMADLIGYDPETASGTFTSGGSLANLTALWVAREKTFRKELQKEDDEFEGKYIILVNPFIHYSIEKAAQILGGPKKDIEVIRVGSKNLAMDPISLAELIEAIEEHNNTVEKEITQLSAKSGNEDKITKLKKTLKRIMAIVSIAGETETGVVDTIAEINDVAKKYGIYHHVDAAYGLPYLLSSRGHLFDGISKSDSVTFDPHKALYTPYSAGAVIFKDPEDHGLVKFDKAAYVFKPGEDSLGQKRVEGSMGAGSILATIAAIHSIDSGEYKALFDHTLNNIEYLFDTLDKSRVLMPIHYPDLNVICFTIRPEVCEQLEIKSDDALNGLIEKTRQRLNDEFGFFFSSTDLPIDDSVKPFEEGGCKLPVYRAVLMHPRTEKEQIDKAISLLEQLVLDY